MSKRSSTRLSETQVRERLASYQDVAVTNELYSFGEMMVDKALERFKNLDTKATAIAAYAIGIITLLASTQGIWFKSLQSWAFLPLFSAAIAFVAAAFAVSALWLRKSSWFSQDEWLNAKHLKNPEELRRYHLLGMWNVLNSHQTASDGKAIRIALAEGSLITSAVLLVITLGAVWIFGFPLGLGI